MAPTQQIASPLGASPPGARVVPRSRPGAQARLSTSGSFRAGRKLPSSPSGVALLGARLCTAGSSAARSSFLHHRASATRSLFLRRRDLRSRELVSRPRARRWRWEPRVQTSSREMGADREQRRWAERSSALAAEQGAEVGTTWGRRCRTCEGRYSCRAGRPGCLTG